MAFSKIYDIINKLNKKLRRKQMSLKSYLIVVDTTEERFLRSIGKGILNVHISLAETAEIARGQFLKVFNPAIAEQIKKLQTYYYLGRFGVVMKFMLVFLNIYLLQHLIQIDYDAVNAVTNPIYPAPIAVLYFVFFPKATTVLE